MQITLGVLITYHNERELLRECLESLLNQSEKPDEVLVYDDASDYPAEDYVPAGFPVRIIRGDVNRGPSYGRNVLLHASRSDYMHFHDADDLFHPDWARRIRQAIAETGVDVVFTEVSSLDEEGRLLCERVLGLERLCTDGDLVRFCIQGAMLAPAGTYRREIILAIGGYREELWQTEDYEFHIRLAVSGVQYMNILDPLISIRVRSAGRSQKQEEVWASALEALKIAARELSQKYHQDLSEAAASVGSKLFQLGMHKQAREAFDFAFRLGRPTFSGKPWTYRIIARLVGPYITEQIGQHYRCVIPEQLRRLLHTL